MDNGRQLAQVARNLEEAKNAGISMTPSYVINGALIPGGPPIEDLAEIIEEELIKANVRE
jgi:protein-disulfide isomerase